MNAPHRSPHRLLVVAATALAVGLSALLAPAASAAVLPAVDVRPVVLDRGADPRVPHVEGNRVVDGSTRVRVRGRQLSLLGERPDGFVVSVLRRGSWRVLFAPPGGEPFLLARGVAPNEAAVSSNGGRLAYTRSPGRARSTRVTVIDTGDGSVVAARAFPGSRWALDVDGTKVLLGSGGRTVAWRFESGRAKVLTSTGGYLASITADRLATFTRDPYFGGCTTVRRLSTPRRVIWRSCGQRVDSFAPGGRRVITIHKLADGLGPDVMTLRRVDGTRLARYRIRNGSLGPVVWEPRGAVLLEAHGRSFGALVRCERRSCERATDLRGGASPI